MGSRGRGVVVAPLGLSPPVVSEFVEYLVRIGEPPSEVVIIRTEDPEVSIGFAVLQAALGTRYPSLRVRDFIVRTDDVNSQDDVCEFLLTAAKALSAAQGRWPLRILVSGGRKSMTVALTILAPFLPVEGVYHVIMPPVKVASYRLEAVREIMKEVASSGDPKAAYEKRRDQLDPVMWPPVSEYRVVKLPVVPYPPDVALALTRVLREGGWRRDLPDELLLQLSVAGLIRVGEGSKVLVTELGEGVGRALARLMAD